MTDNFSPRLYNPHKHKTGIRNTLFYIRNMMIIPYTQLSSATLQSLIEDFVTRDGTDYGDEEISVERKIQQIQLLLKKGDIVIVFDAFTETCNIMTKSNAENAANQQE